MDSLLLTTLAAFYYDFLLEASSEVATISTDIGIKEQMRPPVQQALETRPSLLLSLIMEITITNFNQIQGDEFDQIGKIFAADLHTFLINYEVTRNFFLVLYDGL